MAAVQLSPATISKTPAGLLGLLGLKNGGRYPASLSPELVTQIDQLGFLSAYHGQDQNLNTTVAAASFITFLTVPPGEIWIIPLFACLAISGVGEAISCTLSVSHSLTGGTVYVDRTITLGASTSGAMWSQTSQPLILRSDDLLGVSVHSVTGTVDLAFSARTLRCLV